MTKQPSSDTGIVSTYSPDTQGEARQGQALPFPDTEFSPGVQRAIERKIESGEDPGIDRDEFFRIFERIGKLQESDQ